MTMEYIFEDESSPDGTLVLRLPPGQRYQIIARPLEPVAPPPPLAPEEEAALDAELAALLASPNRLHGRGLTLGEILKLPGFGIYANSDIPDGETYVEMIRRKTDIETW